MGITCIAFMLKGTEPVTVEDVVNHFDHVRDLVGTAMGSIISRSIITRSMRS
jgi:hypothetical protein